MLEGYGFDSNEQLTHYAIRNVAGIFPANSFQPGSGGRSNRAAATDTVSQAPDTPAEEFEVVTEEDEKAKED